MANTTLTASVVAKAALAILDNELDVLGTFYRAPESEFEKSVNGYTIGDTISIRRPADFTVRSTITASQQDVIEGKVALTIDQVRGVDFNFTSTDLTLNIQQLGERVIRPAVVNIVNAVLSDVLETAYPAVYGYASAGGLPVNSFAKFSKLGERMDNMAIPTNQRYACLNTGDYWAMLGSQTALYVQDAARKAYRDGALGNIAGIETMSTQLMPTHVAGTATGTPLVNGAAQGVLYDAVKNTWSQSLVTDGWTASQATILKAGDVFTIAGAYAVNPKTKAALPYLQTFVALTNAASDGSGNATLSISPPIIASGPYKTVTAAPADNAAIVVVTAGANAPVSLGYHKNAIALAMVPMVRPPGAVDCARESKNGISIRVVPYYDGANDKSSWRMDVLYGRKLIDPRLAVRLGA